MRQQSAPSLAGTLDDAPRLQGGSNGAPWHLRKDHLWLLTRANRLRLPGRRCRWLYATFCRRRRGHTPGSLALSASASHQPQASGAAVSCPCRVHSRQDSGSAPVRARWGRSLFLALCATLLLWPAGAEARAHHHLHAQHHARHAQHHARHALRHHRAHRADAGCPEIGGENPTWAEWRTGMIAAGFSREETEEIEVCPTALEEEEAPVIWEG